jgi:hypothetical protein
MLVEKWRNHSSGPYFSPPIFRQPKYTPEAAIPIQKPTDPKRYQPLMKQWIGNELLKHIAGFSKNSSICRVGLRRYLDCSMIAEQPTIMFQTFH